MIGAKSNDLQDANEKINRKLDVKQKKLFFSKNIVRATSRDFQDTKDLSYLPNLLEAQVKSYQKILERNSKGENFIDSIVKSYFPITSTRGFHEIKYLKSTVEEPIYLEEFYMNNLLSYTSKIYLHFKLNSYGHDKDGNHILLTVQKYKYFFAEVPIVTKQGSFLINGMDKIIVMALSRTPGVLFLQGKDEEVTCKIIPERGSWVEITLHRGVLYARLDKKKKIPATVLLTALGYSTGELLDHFYSSIIVKIKRRGKPQFSLSPSSIKKGIKLPFDLVHEGEVIAKAFRPLAAEQVSVAKRVKAGIEIPRYFILNSRLRSPIKIGENTLSANTKIIDDTLEAILLHKVSKIDILVDAAISQDYILASTLEDAERQNINDQLSALVTIIQVTKGVDTVVNIMEWEDSLNHLKSMYEDMLFSKSKYSLSPVGRFQINYKLGLNRTEDYITAEDFIAIFKRFVKVEAGELQIENQDSLENKRITLAKDHVIALANSSVCRLAQGVKEVVERIKSEDANLKCSEIFTIKNAGSTILQFFKHNPLAQFTEQENSLCSLSHKRRITYSRSSTSNANWRSISTRDVNPSSYGRICAIETPEGLNVGLTNSLARFATIDDYGFISAPYFKVVDGKLTDEHVYLNSIQEKEFRIAARNLQLDKENRILGSDIQCRYQEEVIQIPASEVDYVDISYNQMTAVCASLIPFIERNEGKRALMGSNIQKQSVPLMKKQYPLIGTGMESHIAKDSYACITSQHDGEVVQISEDAILIRRDGSEEVDIYPVEAFKMYKKNVFSHDIIEVSIGEKVKVGDILINGASCLKGDLALGANVKIAYLSVDGFNFEDSILASERMLSEETMTSIHLQTLVCNLHETAFGNEEITVDIPYVPAASLQHLDEQGIVVIGTQVQHGDLLVGKITPKEEEKSTPEDRLLKAIFGERVLDVKNSSLKVPKGVSGTVINVEHIKRRGTPLAPYMTFYEKNIYSYLNETLLLGKLKEGCELEDLDYNFNILEAAASKDDKFKHFLDKISMHVNFRKTVKDTVHSKRLDSNVVEQVRITLASKSVLQQGDKISSRHGNKGTISSLFLQSDMPYMENGDIVDMVFTPLGIPSRMNIGQLFEATFGLISQKLSSQLRDLIDNGCSTSELRDMIDKIYNVFLRSKLNVAEMSDDDLFVLAETVRNGIPIAQPGFDTMSYEELDRLMEICGFEKSRNFQLYDGRTGEALDHQSCVGVLYCFKLNHMIENKIHARSSGPYSLVTQQPLSGKSHMGGQRVGEMECWALEAYGASYTLQEMLTIKSDDIQGRSTMYRRICSGDHALPENLSSESYNLLKREINALCLNLEEIYAEEDDHIQDS